MVMSNERRKHSVEMLSKQSAADVPEYEVTDQTLTGALTPKEVNMIASKARRIGWPRTLGELVTVALIPPVADQLRCLQKNTNMSATDLTNRAITSYAFIDEQMRAGNDLMVRDTWTGETRLVRFA
jgi:hypothetical protein